MDLVTWRARNGKWIKKKSFQGLKKLRGIIKDRIAKPEAKLRYPFNSRTGKPFVESTVKHLQSNL